MSKQKTDIEIIELTEENIGSMVYTIRGVKVMLDFDLARIYGYSTNAFNQQVKRNIDKFPEDFMFRLTDTETRMILRSQIVTANELSSQRRYNPYAFTEQGVYMLMTVLKGDLAIKQSIALAFAVMFICGSSSKDAGKRVTTITQIDSCFLYHPLVENLLLNEVLDLLY